MYVPQLTLNTALASLGIREDSTEHHFIVDKYNSIKPYPRGYMVKYSDSWCAVFVTYCADMNNITGFPRECGVMEMFNKFMCTENYCISSKPQKGMPVFFNYSHTGIIENLDDSNIYTIEGNANNSVLRQVHNRNASYIMGYGHYCKETTVDVDLIAREVIAGKWGNNPQRKQMLESAGYNYQTIQDKVNQILNSQGV